jgi:predicted nuclease of predicted toxin-antitoxin system
MNFKLDENFGRRTQQLFRDAGHDVQTMFEESLGGVSDQQLYQICCAEQRCLVTLDLDFSDVTRFSPKMTGGIVVVRVPRNPSRTLLEGLVRQFLQALGQRSVAKNLWVVEPGRIRIHQAETDNE